MNIKVERTFYKDCALSLVPLCGPTESVCLQVVIFVAIEAIGSLCHGLTLGALLLEPFSTGGYMMLHINKCTTY